MFVACLFLCHFAFEKEPARLKRKAINIYFAQINTDIFWKYKVPWSENEVAPPPH